MQSRGGAEESYLTTGEVARRLGVTPGAVSRWAKRRKITPAIVTPGGRYRWLWSEVQQQMREWQLREQEQDE